MAGDGPKGEDRSMSDATARVRRPISQALPAAERSSRRTAWWLGGALGIVVGVVVALFVVPPLMGRYFGTADVGLGDDFRRDGATLTFETFEELATAAGGRTITATLRLRATEEVAVGLADARLHLEGGAIIPAERPPEPHGGAADAPVRLQPGADLRAVLTFVIPAGLGTKPEYIELEAPRVRFHFEPGEPE